MPSRRPAPPGRASRPGIVQIAHTLGVSPSTVSRALRPATAHLVNAGQRKRILDLAEKLHFSPNPGARMLRNGVNATLAVVVPMDENIFFSEFYGRFLAGTLHAAAARGWNVQIRTLKRRPETGIREDMQHLALDTSGVIYLAEPLSSADLEQLRGYRRPLVLTKSALPPGVDVRDAGAPVIGVDNAGGAQAAARLLLQLGHRRIGLLLGPHTSRDAYERRQGYLEALRAAGAEPRGEWIAEGEFSADAGREAMTAMLKKTERPTALCCASDDIAFGALGAIQAAGLRCPEDISVVGFDDGLWATAAHPALTTVRQPLADMADRAVGLVTEAARSPNRHLPAAASNMPASLVFRESTAPCAG